MKKYLSTYLLLLSLLLPSCSSESDSPDTANINTDPYLAETDQDIQNALQHLKHRTNLDNYVIFEAETSDVYIQFTLDLIKRKIYYDFPIKFIELQKTNYQILAYDIEVDHEPNSTGNVQLVFSDETYERLIKFLKCYHLKTNPTQLFGRDPEDKIVSYMKTIKGQLNISPRRYAAFIREYFQQVHQLKPDHKIIITEN